MSESAKEGGSQEVEKTLEEIKAEAAETEAENKKLKAEKAEKEELSNQTKRLEKAKAKQAELEGDESDKKSVPDPKEEKSEDIAPGDLISLSKNNIDEGSDKHKVLQKHLDGGLIKSYEEGFNSIAVKAEFEEIDRQAKAEAVVDESDQNKNTDGSNLQTASEKVEGYQQDTSKMPNDPKVIEQVAAANLKDMGLIQTAPKL